MIPLELVQDLRRFFGAFLERKETSASMYYIEARVFFILLNKLIYNKDYYKDYDVQRGAHDLFNVRPI